MALLSAGLAPFSVALGSTDSEPIGVGLPVLRGSACEKLFADAKPAGSQGRFRLARQDRWLIGGAVLPVGGDLEAATTQLYRDLFAAVGANHLARIWNYVPEINETGPGGLENYRIFCRGRSLAFETHYGARFNAVLPAASAVGGPAGFLSMVFAAHATKPEHIENSLQLPAYRYPADYGPRPPSFCRATVVADSPARQVFISGTAAIRGHLTMAPHETQDQLACTLGNLAEISRACGLGSDLGADSARRRHFKVYVRHAAECGEIARTLEKSLLRTSDTVYYLLADACRRELKVEIEATLTIAG